MLNPVTLLIVGLITGVGGAVTYTTFHYAQGANPKLTATDLLPMPPPYPPVPRFFYNKELMESLRRR